MKRSMRLNFRSVFGNAKFKSDLLTTGPLHGDSAAGSYDKLVLRGGNNRTWARHLGGYASNKVTQTVDEFFRATQIDASGYGSRGTYVHLYINGIYWGLYNPVERPDSKFSASYFGGDSEDWFAANHRLIDPREPVENRKHLSGDISRYNYLTNTLIYKDMSDPANYDELQQYLDTRYFIDYLLLSWWGNIQNWPYNNLFFGNRNETSPLGTTPLYFTRWDSEFSFDQNFDFGGSRAQVHNDFRNNRNVNSDIPIVAKIWHSARTSSLFMQQFVERVDALTGPGGALNDDVARARWATLNNFVRDAIIAESARWGDTLISLGKPRRTRDVDWQREVDHIDGLLQGNATALINSLRAEGYYP